MPWMTAAAVVGSSLIGGSMQADAAGDAAALQAGATDRATGLSERQFNVTRQDQAPFREGGVAAMQMLRNFMGMGKTNTPLVGKDAGGGTSFNPALLNDPEYLAAWHGIFGGPDQGDSRTWDTESLENTLRSRLSPEYLKKLEGQSQPTGPDAGLMGRRFTIDDFWADPVTKLGHQTGLDLGTKALYNASPLTTGRDSGAMLKELTKFGTDYTGMKAADSESRFEGNKSNVFNRLMAMIGGGQVANQVNAGAGANMANNVGNLVTSGANAQGAARIAGANAWGGGVQNIGNWWQQNNMLDRFEKMRTPSLSTWSSSPMMPPSSGAWQNNYAGGS